VNKKKEPLATIEEGDAIIFWNFRSDRARQLTYAFTGNAPNEFNPKKTPSIHFVSMSVYDKGLNIPVAYPQHKVKNNLAQVLKKNRLKQLRIAETEKYAHVTFFFNSQVEKPVKGEDRILVPSSKVSSYEKKPEMSAFEINKKLIPLILSGFYDFILVNYANCDLVGHSANLSAGIKACETVDACIGELVNAALKMEYVILITGDHGNVETMLYPNGEPNPSHGMNPVPFILVSKEQFLKRVKLNNNLGLSSVAPTILNLMGLDLPTEMTGENIIKNIL
jgi:2,3-bisphosphoglycerate-independent phosphoglycerate mutase